MKSPIKILLILFAFLQLIFVTYLSIGAIPVKIENETAGDMYSFEKISFNFASDKYTKVSNRKDENKLTVVFSNSKINQEIFILTITDSEQINIFNQNLKDLQNPFKSRSLELKMRKDQQEQLGNTEPTLKKVTAKVHIGKEKIFILQTETFDDGSVLYSARGRIENNYYSITLAGDANPEDMYEFMRSVTLL